MSFSALEALQQSLGIVGDDWRQAYPMDSWGRMLVPLFEWQDARKRWHPYNGEAAMIILEAARHGQDATEVTLENSAYTINVASMLQVNKSTRRERPIRPFFQYQWQNGRGRWFPFGIESNAQIVHAQLHGCSAVAITVGDQAYTIDGWLMEQRNDASGRVRPIRLTPILNSTPLEASCKSAPSCAVDRGRTEYVLKITYLADVRRVKVDWPRGSGSEDVHACILNAVKMCFDALPSHIICQYVDSDGDACTLVESTVEDFLSFELNGVLRLHVSCGASHPNASMTVAPPPTESLNWCISTPPTSPCAAQHSDAVDFSIEDDFELIKWT